MKLGKVNLRGKELYITDKRIRDNEQIEGLNYYHIRHTDADWSEPCSIEHKVTVNHFGSVVTKDDLSELINNDYIELTDEETQLIQRAVATANIEYEDIK